MAKIMPFFQNPAQIPRRARQNTIPPTKITCLGEPKSAKKSYFWPRNQTGRRMKRLIALILTTLLILPAMSQTDPNGMREFLLPLF